MIVPTISFSVFDQGDVPSHDVASCSPLHAAQARLPMLRNDISPLFLHYVSSHNKYRCASNLSLGIYKIRPKPCHGSVFTVALCGSQLLLRHGARKLTFARPRHDREPGHSGHRTGISMWCASYYRKRSVGRALLAREHPASGYGTVRT